MHDYSSDLKGPYENDECHDHEYPATESPYIVGFALESNLALSSEISQCSLHPSMIYSDVEQDDQLNKCTSSDSFISTFTTESSDITTHTDLLDRIQQLHHKFAFVRVGNDLLLDPTSNQTHMNETMRSSISPSSLSSVSPEEVQPGFFSSSRLSFVRKLIKKIKYLGSCSTSRNNEVSSSPWWSSFSSCDWERIKESYPALETELFESMEETSFAGNMDVPETDEEKRKRIELMLATLLDQEEEVLQSLRFKHRTNCFYEMALIALLLSMGVHSFFKRS